MRVARVVTLVRVVRVVSAVTMNSKGLSESMSDCIYSIGSRHSVESTNSSDISV